MTDDEPKDPPPIFRLCEEARRSSGALGAMLILFNDVGGMAGVSFAWDGSNDCHAIAPQSLRLIADAVEKQGKGEQPKAH